MKHIETNLSKIEHLAHVREDENFRFRAFLKEKDGEKVDRIVHRLHEEITGKIDCLSCGNCCKLQVELDEEDIEVLSRLENISPESYEDSYCETDAFGDVVLKVKPCRYLEGTTCTIHEHKPRRCKEFPNTHKKDFNHRLLGMISYYEICPIVFNLMEQLKDEMRFRR